MGSQKKFRKTQKNGNKQIIAMCLKVNAIRKSDQIKLILTRYVHSRSGQKQGKFASQKHRNKTRLKKFMDG